MELHPLVVLALYASAIVAASLLGGWLPMLVRITHTGMQTAMSLVAGFIIGMALYHLLPHGVARIQGDEAIKTAAWWMMFGIFMMFILLRLGHFHQHETATEGHDHRRLGTGGGGKPIGWVGITLGLSLHTLTEGMALGAAVRSAELGAELIGLGVFLTILLHKPLDALSIAGLMKLSGIRRQLRMRANLGFALICPVGALLAYFVTGLTAGPAQEQVIGYALSIAAGAFLCIALSDILPEVQSHSHNRIRLSAAFLIGLAGAYGLQFVEAALGGDGATIHAH